REPSLELRHVFLRSRVPVRIRAPRESITWRRGARSTRLRAMHDLIVVGGGIHGVAVARDASRRGLSVLLLERGDIASGTSGRTSKLVHGGIRYLETGQFALVREALRERATLLRVAPAFVRPLPFLLPHYRSGGRSRAAVGLGLWLYGCLARRDALAARGSLSRRSRSRRFPVSPRTALP